MARGSLRGWSLFVGAALALSPATSLAGDETLGTENGLTYMRDSTPIGAGATAMQIVQCPFGQRLFGGGADSVSGQIGGLLNGARPVDGGDNNDRMDDSYAAWAYNSTGSPGDTVVWAVCGPKGSQVKLRSANLPFGGTKAVTAKCPDGTRVTGGGAFVTGEITYAQLKATRPVDDGDAGRKPDDGWLVRASNVGPVAQEVTATAVCRAGLSPSYFAELTGFNTSLAGAGAACRDDGTSVSGAGGDVRGQGSTARISGVLLDDNTIEAGTVPDDVVDVQAQNASPDEGDEFGPNGVCLALP